MKYLSAFPSHRCQVLRALGANPILWGIFLVSLALRILAITVPFNVDEGNWMSRGSLFLWRLLEGDLAETYLRHHPGVPNMWLTGSSQLLNCQLHKLVPGWLSLNQVQNLEACLNTSNFPIGSYVMPRLLQAVITSACMVGIYILAQRLLGRPAALAGISLLILEPFFLAYQRLITTDALQTDFGILGLLLLLLYLRGDGTRRTLVASGSLMGLAVAAKIPTIFVLPGVGLWIILIELGVWQASFPQRGWKRQTLDMMLWGITFCVVIFLIWPALWVAPLETLAKLYEGLLQEADTGDQFFWGQVTDSPGLIFYPLALAYRLSPTLQVGLLTCLAVLLIPRLRQHLAKIPELVALTLIPISVLVIVSVIARKYDRYMMIIWPELALLAGAGWRIIGAWVKYWGTPFWSRGREKWRTIRGVKTALILALAQIIFLVPHYPYYLTYYNPLLGGPRVAKNLLMMGQGEGLEGAAQWLNQSPKAREMKVSAWYGAALTPYFQGETKGICRNKCREPRRWTGANRVVFYINQIQRRFPESEMLDYFLVQEPLYTVQLHGVDYVQVYPGPVPLPEDLEQIQVPLFRSFGEQVRLLGYDLNTSILKSGEKLLVTFYWEFLEPVPPNFTLNMSLSNEDGNRFNASEASLLNGYLPLAQIAPGQIIRDVRKLTITPKTSPGFYRLEVGWFSPNKKQALPVQDGNKNSQGNQAFIAEVEIVKSVRP